MSNIAHLFGSILNGRIKPLRLNNWKQIERTIFNKNKEEEINSKDLVRVKEFFNEEGLKSNFDRNHFIKTLDNFNDIKKLKRFGYTEFLAAALPAMKEFGVDKDIESYKALMRIFPKGAFIPSSPLVAGFFPNYVQQTSAVKLLNQMETNLIMPDRELEEHIIAVFSKHSMVWRKCARMTYWMTKAKNANPFPLPEKLPNDPLELAIVALRRMTIYIDPQAELYVYQTKQVENSNEDTWICFVQSDSQCEIIETMDFDKYRISIDGPFNVWVNENQISYYVLYARQLRPPENRDLVEEYLSAEQENNDVSNIPLSNFGGFDIKAATNPLYKKHQQDDGTILSVVSTGTSSQNSLTAWLRLLIQHNPRLSLATITISANQSSTEQNKKFNQLDMNLNRNTKEPKEQEEDEETKQQQP